MERAVCARVCVYLCDHQKSLFSLSLSFFLSLSLSFSLSLSLYFSLSLSLSLSLLQKHTHNL